MTDLELFNAAREAGLGPARAVRYVRHVRLHETTGRTPLTPKAAARDDPPINIGYPMQVYAEHVGFIHREDER